MGHCKDILGRNLPGADILGRSSLEEGNLGRKEVDWLATGKAQQGESKLVGAVGWVGWRTNKLPPLEEVCSGKGPRVLRSKKAPFQKRFS